MLAPGNIIEGNNTTSVRSKVSKKFYEITETLKSTPPKQKVKVVKYQVATPVKQSTTSSKF